jgi:cell wall-associated NlpC family hydrolase
MRRCLVALFASFALVGVTLPASAEDSIELDPSWYQIEPTPEQNQEKAAENRAQSAAKANRQMRAAIAKGEKLVTIAAKLRGTPYRFAGSSPRTGFDCSGYTSYVYRQLGIELPRSSGAIRNVAKKVNKADLRKGDLVFWHSKSGRVFHVGIYAGGGKAWHAPRPGRSVTLQSIWLAGGRQTSYVTYGRI